jgi:hypothetical protein
MQFRFRVDSASSFVLRTNCNTHLEATPYFFFVGSLGFGLFAIFDCLNCLKSLFSEVTEIPYVETFLTALSPACDWCLFFIVEPLTQAFRDEVVGLLQIFPRNFRDGLRLMVSLPRHRLVFDCNSACGLCRVPFRSFIDLIRLPTLDHRCVRPKRLQRLLKIFNKRVY